MWISSYEWIPAYAGMTTTEKRAENVQEYCGNRWYLASKLQLNI